LLGLQAQAPVLPSEPVVAEEGLISVLSTRLLLLGRFLKALARWWMQADFRNRQVPVLVVALAIWGITAQEAWESQESATPFLKHSISFLHQEQQARAAVAASIPSPQGAGRVRPSAYAPADAHAAAEARPLQPAAAEVRHAAPQPGRSLPSLLAASLDSLFDAQPARAAKVEGNPRRRVWVDMKTGLYYCPGASYYGFGGRGRGKVMSQKDAEYEYFQPATGAACR
jgi:hypothetical protein